MLLSPVPLCDSCSRLTACVCLIAAASRPAPTAAFSSLPISADGYGVDECLAKG